MVKCKSYKLLPFIMTLLCPYIGDKEQVDIFNYPAKLQNNKI